LALFGHIIFICFSLASLTAIAQDYFMKQYRVDSGLPSDIIKASTQDSLGYFWIATDEGLVKYDGIQFTNYRDRLHSNFVKGFHTTRDGRLLAFGDLDFIEIINQEDTVIFNRLFHVGRIADDTTLTYPKLIFEDAGGNLWVSESQAVVKLNENSFNRYSFDISNRTPQFLRSFSFFEDQNNHLYVSSFQGNLFRYNTDDDKFEPVEKKLPYGIEFISDINNSLIIGSLSGVYRASLPEKGGIANSSLISNIPNVSFIAHIGDNKHFIATREIRHFLIDFDSNSIDTLPHSINNINHIHVSRENDIWLSGNEGWVLIRENIFQKVNDNVIDFIETVTENPSTQSIYYANSTRLYELNRKTNQNSLLLELPSGYFQSLLYTDDGLWIANAFKVFLMADNEIRHEFDFSNKTRFITGLSRDSKENIWLSIPGLEMVYMIDPNLHLKEYSIPLGDDGVINIIRTGENGIYVASSGQNSYLFFKDKSDSDFQNISIPLDLDQNGSFNVNDIAIDGDFVWLGTSHGLYKLNHWEHTIENSEVRFLKLPINAIHTFGANKILIANAYGLIIYNTKLNTYELYNESTGLPSNTITPRGFFVGSDSTIWVGTAKGLCYSKHSLTDNSVTPAPRFTQIESDGVKRRLNKETEIDFGSFLSIHISSITFPEDEVNYQYRILPSEQWRSTYDNEITFDAQKAGDFTIEVKARKNGPYSWSQPSVLAFSIAKPFWQKWWFFLLGALTIALLIGGTFYGVNIYNEKRNERLKQLINERTEELRQSNETLVRLNSEKNNLIGIVAHDLKNPLSQIKGLISIINMSGKVDKESAKNIEMMDHSASRMNEMITKILDVNAIESEKLNLSIEKVNLSEEVHDITRSFESIASAKNIKLIKNIISDLYVKADRNYTIQVIENILSNAIKFSPFNKCVHISLSSKEKEVICEIKDEGPGISQKDMKNLFGKYQRLSARPTGGEASTGLGLMIAKKFIETMGGRIWCKSETGSGASFFISLKK